MVSQEVHAAENSSAHETSPTADVRLIGVSKQFGSVTAVDDLTLEIERGEFFSLLGPSGCGKTTTLRMIGGFEEPSAGEIYLGGQRVTHVPPYRRDVNTVFQSYALFPHLTVAGNVAFGLHRRRTPSAEITRRVAGALHLVDLQGMSARKPSQLSGGQQQRVAVARALVNHPRVLLLDEPLGALDARLRKQMQLELKRIQMEVGITFIYVTHDQEEALTMSDRLAVMNRGQIEQLGAPRDVYDRPGTEFVARFLGESNLLEGTVSRDGVVLPGGEVIRVGAHQLAGRGSRVKVGVRPEKITIEPADDAPMDGFNRIEGRLQLVTFAGVSYQYTVEGPQHVVLGVFAPSRGSSPIARAGDRVWLQWHPDDSFVVEA
jgi:spermidine/putrescine transport system ATP-binding protein